jgi:hypothetical protein
MSSKNAFLLLNFLVRNAAPEQKFGALNMTAALGPWIMRHPEVKNNMEQFMLQFVTPELASPQPYIRAIVRLFTFSVLSEIYNSCLIILQALEILGTVTKAGLTWSDKEVCLNFGFFCEDSV